MKARVKPRRAVPQKVAATDSRILRTFLLMRQFEAQEIGARIAQARKELGLTQEQLAEMASFSRRSLQDYESGLTIPYRHFRELSRLLRRTPEWFLYGDDEGASAETRTLAERLGDVVERLEAIVQSFEKALTLVEARRDAEAADLPGRREDQPGFR